MVPIWGIGLEAAVSYTNGLPGGEQCESREHRATIHLWITSSARSRSDCGIVTPMPRVG
jgi:hypothetical protein